MIEIIVRNLFRNPRFSPKSGLHGGVKNCAHMTCRGGAGAGGWHKEGVWVSRWSGTVPVTLTLGIRNTGLTMLLPKSGCVCCGQFIA